MANYMAEALALARQAASEKEVPVGAIIVKDGVVVGRGYNRREQNQDPLAHAECIAIRDAAASLKSWRLENCELYVTLEPCPMCLGACQQARVKKVIYGTSDPKGGALSLGYKLNEDGRINHRFEVSLSDTAESVGCGQVLKDFFKERRS